MSTPRPAPTRLQLFGWSLALIGMAVPSYVLLATLLTSMGLTLIWLGFPFLLGLLALLRKFTNVHRRRAGWVLGTEIEKPYRARVPGHGMYRRVFDMLTDSATWRDVAWLFVEIVVGSALAILNVALLLGGIAHITLATWWWSLPADADVNLLGALTVNSTATAIFVGIPVGLLYIAIWYFASPRIMRAQAWLTASLLAPTEAARLANRVQQLTVSRADTVDTQAAELRRIERDLHDGAQARLVALGMSLGMAEETVARDPAAARELLAEARAASSQALAELRDLVRGIHPPVLADRGLDGAIQALVLANPLTTHVDVDIPGRLSAPVESAAYFAVAETLTNVTKHAEAGKAWIRLTYDEGKLTILVGDDGRGGADASGGTGLRGIERRLSAFDGTLVVSSPIGGPTVVVMSVPCELIAAE
ncbi:sensor domain-containing protein [Kibdelosporangium philippinense]|uniref:histidine kinase n=1 Tax=Kibdelosporangium philippinense TaxID=211113 RepID=A0ABS8ZR43_9PSEU|nr:sensor domain-containing protein [Kibdelosporangium philippinense]MCE7008928.1 sensor domain-containing protein [Kibdelosporangium philippinense]